jgi:hypothetical protein
VPLLGDTHGLGLAGSHGHDLSVAGPPGAGGLTLLASINPGPAPAPENHGTAGRP